MFQITADGQAWVDADGRDSWIQGEALALANLLERNGYTTTLHEI